MKKILTVAVLTLAVGSASAADLPFTKAPVAPPPLPPSWAGFYAGPNAGYTWSNQTVDNISTAVPGPTPGLLPSDLAAAAAAGATTSIGVGNNHFIGGGQIGWNYQSNNWVAGVEADIQGPGATGSGAATLVTNLPHFTAFAYQTTTTVSESLDYLGTVRGRFGVSTPTFLIYATGGLAYGHVSSSWSLVSVTPPATGGPTIGAGASASATRTGWAAGAGAEWMFASSWSAKFEFLHYDLGSIASSAVLVQPSGGFTAFFNPVQSTAHFNGNIVRAGVNFHFNAVH